MVARIVGALCIAISAFGWLLDALSSSGLTADGPSALWILPAVWGIYFEVVGHAPQRTAVTATQSTTQADPTATTEGVTTGQASA